MNFLLAVEYDYARQVIQQPSYSTIKKAFERVAPLVREEYNAKLSHVEPTELQPTNLSQYRSAVYDRKDLSLFYGESSVAF